MIESLFGYGTGYVYNSKSSNFSMTDASNLAAIKLLALFPIDSYAHTGCFCVECAAIWHERERIFDTIKQEIEICMKIAFQEGKRYEQERLSKEES